MRQVIDIIWNGEGKMISMHDITDSTAELEEARDLGIREFQRPDPSLADVEDTE